MKYYSPIAPVRLLQQLHSADKLDPYLLLLAHDVRVNLAGYQILIDQLNAKYGNVTAILDNSVVELGVPVNPDEMLSIGTSINASHYALPDIMTNASETIQQARRAIIQYINVGVSHTQLMKIPQGSSVLDIHRCIEALADMSPGPMWGVPRWFTYEFGSRIGFIEKILEEAPDAKIHLLGMYQNLQDDLFCATHPSVTGIDSANPIVMGQQRLCMPTSTWVHYDRGDLWEQSMLLPETMINVDFMREKINEKS